MPKKTPNYIARNTIAKRWEWCWLQSWQGQVAFWSAWLGIFYNTKVCHQQAWSTLWLFSLDPSEPERTSALRLLRFCTHWCTVSCQMIPLQHCSHYMPGHKVGKKTIVWHVSLSTSSGAWRSEVTITVKNALMQLMLIILATSPRRAKQSDICRQSLLLYSLSCWPCMPFYMSLGYRLHGRKKSCM